MTQQNRKLPLGIQDFEEMRRDHYIYADKTDMVWKLANGTKYNYLSRPRRFGKSLLCSKLKCYFEGRKELFEGLKMMELETVIIALKQYRLYHSNDTASLAWLQVSLFTWLAIPV